MSKEPTKQNIEGITPQVEVIGSKLDSVAYEMGNIENHSKALILTLKNHLFQSEEQSPYIKDIEKNACNYKDDNEILLQFVLSSLQQLTDNISKQYETILNLN